MKMKMKMKMIWCLLFHPKRHFTSVKGRSTVFCHRCRYSFRWTRAADADGSDLIG